MTKQESFKRRIRERMAKTGERYAAARRQLLAQAAGESRRREWQAEPEFGDDAVRNATGRGWDDWCDLLADRPDGIEGHTAIATYLRDDLQVDAWWSQAVTGGYERITGLRLPYERPDGTFTASKSKTVVIDAAEFRAMLLDEAGRATLFPGQSTSLRSRVDAKSVRIELGPGVSQFGITPAAPTRNGEARTKVVVQHEQLATYELVEEWKFYWGEWLEAIDGVSAASDVPAS